MYLRYNNYKAELLITLYICIATAVGLGPMV